MVFLSASIKPILHIYIYLLAVNNCEQTDQQTDLKTQFVDLLMLLTVLNWHCVFERLSIIQFIWDADESKRRFLPVMGQQ